MPAERDRPWACISEFVPTSDELSIVVRLMATAAPTLVAVPLFAVPSAVALESALALLDRVTTPPTLVRVTPAPTATSTLTAAIVTAIEAATVRGAPPSSAEFAAGEAPDAGAGCAVGSGRVVRERQLVVDLAVDVLPGRVVGVVEGAGRAGGGSARRPRPAIGGEVHRAARRQVAERLGDDVVVRDDQADRRPDGGGQGPDRVADRRRRGGRELGRGLDDRAATRTPGDRYRSARSS